MKQLFTMMLALILPLTVMAQDRSVRLTIQVGADTGESLYRQKVTLRQTEYDVSYGSLTLNSEGSLTLKVYPGTHQIIIERSGFVTLSEVFTLAADETERTVSFTLHEAVTQPYALQTETIHNAYTGDNSIHISWNREQPSFFDDFEQYEAFSVQFGDWTGFDLDNEVAAALYGYYPNRGVMQYAQIINPLTVQPTWWYEYPILRPYSGKQYVGFTRTSSGNANNDWLVSPVIHVGEHNILSFLAKAADQYPERFMVYVTTNTVNPQTEDFVRIDQGNYETADYTGWKECVYSLNDYADSDIRFAIRYISEYNRYGSFMLMVDDVYVGQDTSDSNVNPNESFQVYLDGELVATTTETEYTFENVETGNHTVGVKAVYTKAESDTTEISVGVGVGNFARVLFRAEANSKLSANGQKLLLTNTSSAEQYELTIADGQALMASLPFGNYIIRLEEGAFQEYEKTFEIAKDETIVVTLEDNVLTPYNITADITQNDGITTVVMRWNQILKFSDSFEDYEDFATGSFGEWKTIDLDQMPTYPIGLGGINPENVVDFPGASTYYDRKAVAPLVFNPWNTTPAMLPTDAAIAALTGNKEIVFFSPAQHKADKWLISPQISIYKDYAVEVAMKSYDGTYLESVDFCVSDGSDNPSDFVAISTANYIPAGEWTIYQTDLSQYEGQSIRIAVHYKSYDTFILQLDDFVVGPAEGETPQADYGNVVRYDIYLDGTLVDSSEEPTYTFGNLTSGSHVVGIVAVYKASESELATYELNVTTGIKLVENGQCSMSDGQWSMNGIRMPQNSVRGHQPVIIRQNGRTFKVIK